MEEATFGGVTAAVIVGDSGTDTLAALGQELVQGNNAYLSVHPERTEEADRIFGALSEGGQIEMPIAD